jgi:hypothetical protein
VRGSRGWQSRPSTAGLGAVSLREHLSPTRQPPFCRCLWSRQARRDAPRPVDACGVAEPDEATPVQLPAPLPPLTLPRPTPHLHTVSSRGSPPSWCVVAPASAGSRAGLLSAVYHQYHRRCRPTSRPMETPMVVCRQCSNQLK